MKNLVSGFVGIVMAISIGLGCSNLGKNANTNNARVNNSTGNNRSGGNNSGGSNSSRNNSTGSNSNDNSSTSNSAPKQPQDTGDLTGTYSVSGRNHRGETYTNDLTVLRIRDGIYEFDWSSQSASMIGYGVQGGDLVAVSLTKGCGAAIYKSNGNKLEGKLTTFGNYDLIEQTATLVSQDKTSGIFDLESTEKVNGSSKSSLTIKASGDYYYFTYKTPDGSFGGKGVRSGDYLAAGVGKATCAYALFVRKNGNMSGVWGKVGSEENGTETAIRK